MEFALLIARLYFGLGIAAHGAQKLFGWFGGYGLAGTGEWLESIGFRPGRLMALGAGLAEAGGGLLLALGLLGPVGPALVLIPMLVATLAVHLAHGFFTQQNGFELPMLFGMGALTFAATGFGSLSLDSWLGLDTMWGERHALIVLAAAIMLVVVMLAARRSPRQEETQQQTGAPASA